MALVTRSAGALVEQAPVAHIGFAFPPTESSAGDFLKTLPKDKYEILDETKAFYDQYLGGGQKSQTDRTVVINIEATGETIGVTAKVSTKVQDFIGLLSGMTGTPGGQITIKKKSATGTKVLKAIDEVPSTIWVSGIAALKAKRREYPHPLFILGGGLGACQTAIDLLDVLKRPDFIMMEKHPDFAGHSWLAVSNRFTKLQTEKGTYHVNYVKPGWEVPKKFGNMKYQTWPSRDQLIRMFRDSAAQWGLYDKMMFNTNLEKVMPKNVNPNDPGSGHYALQYVPVNEEDGDGGIMMSSAVLAWPGNLWDYNQLEFPGEDDFGGYIETCSFDKVDYQKCTGKVVILYGHGAFTIENVRTLVEHRCKKVYVTCRKRNISGMKIVSWMAGQAEVPVPGHIMMDAMQKMYDLVGWDVWSAYSVTTDTKRTFCQIGQKTVFGVTDVYFLAGYYGLMEVVVDEIKRLTPNMAHTKKNKKIECEVILKAIGTSPSFKVDKFLGIKEIVGIWVNGDPLRSVSCNGMFVQARNFGSFSSGPGFAPATKLMTHFVEKPHDWFAVKDALPHNPPSDRPAYVPGATYFMPMFMALNQNLPELNAKTSVMDALKAAKQRSAHPVEEYVAECTAEWNAYIKYFRKHNLVDDRPDPPYPYPLELTKWYVDKAFKVGMGWEKYEGEPPRFFESPEIGKGPPKMITAPAGAMGALGDATLPICLMFPGQGSQYVNMMQEVKDIPAVKEMLEKAQPILGYDILDICLNGPEAKLEETRYCQPALFIGGLAGLEKLRAQNEDAVTKCSIMCGLSLGEYTALCAAGVMTFEDGLRLVKVRGEAMHEAAQVGKQLMLSVAGLDKDKLEPLCQEAKEKAGQDSVCQISNELFPSGFAVGGTEKAITLLKELVEKAGAMQAKILKTAGAFHTPLMQGAQEKLNMALEEAMPSMRTPKHTVWMNASAEPARPGSSPEDIVALLKRQLTNPVLWEPSMKAVIAEGITEFYEVGPMKQLKAMMKRIDPNTWKNTTNIDV